LKTNTAQEVLIHPVQAWQIYFHRDGAWSNPLSSAGAGNSSNTASDKSNPQNLPEGVRLVLELADQAPPQGKITLDWVRPTFTAVKQ
jgi:general secretion pathway protein J